MNFTIKTIGCKVNIYESNKIKNELIKEGFNYIDANDKENYKHLDFYIVNTCSVTSIADKKSRQMLHMAKKSNANVKVIAIGCLVNSIKRLKTDEKKLVEGVDYYFTNEEKSTLPSFLLSLKNDKVNANYKTAEENNIRVREFIKIQDGCNQYCTYCIIPFLRGNIKSKNNIEIINEVKEKVESGAKEIVLTGIHLSSFGLDRVNLSYESEGAIKVAREALVEIMEQVADIDGVERIRLGSLEPRIIDDTFLSKLTSEGSDKPSPLRIGANTTPVGANTTPVGANACGALSNKFCANFCLSLQSGCDNTLKRMNRHYTTTDFEHACKLIRKYIPYATITTDVIVGFPGETETDFIESLNFVKKMRFYNPNIFPYSRRKGTKADEMDMQLTNKVKHDRVKIMIDECNKISKEIEDEYNKKEHDILIEEYVIENGIKYAVGYTKEYIKKKIKIY